MPDVGITYVSADPHASGERAVPTQHREVQWTVRGHWRRQWYAFSQEHRLRWITEHRPGPADAPLVTRDHVYVYGDGGSSG